MRQHYPVLLIHYYAERRSFEAIALFISSAKSPVFYIDKLNYFIMLATSAAKLSSLF